MRPIWPETDANEVSGVSSQEAVRCAIPGMQLRLRRAVLRGTHGDGQATDDIMQEFAMRALERWKDLRDLEKMNGWLASIVRSTLADHWRRISRNLETGEDPCVLAERAETEADAAIDAAPALCPCLTALLLDCAGPRLAMIRSIDVDEEPCRDAAIRLGIKANALHVRLHRARHGLRVLLEDACMGCPEADTCDHWGRALIRRAHNRQ